MKPRVRQGLCKRCLCLHCEWVICGHAFDLLLSLLAIPGYHMAFKNYSDMGLNLPQFAPDFCLV